MSSYYGIDSSSSNDFFSSYFGASSSSSSSSSSTSLLSDYAAIKNGSYYKLAKSYYAKQSSESSSTSSSAASTVTDTEKKNLTMASQDSTSLKKAADALKATGSNSVFNKVASTDEKTGVVTYDYDKDKIKKAVESFISSYNNTVKSAGDVDSTSVLKKTVYMTDTMGISSDLLKNIGISVGTDNTLELDEDKFNSANMTNVRSLFNGVNSIADKVSQKASDISKLALTASGVKNSYTSTANYSSTLSSGSMIDSLL